MKIKGVCDICMIYTNFWRKVLRVCDLPFNHTFTNPLVPKIVPFRHTTSLHNVHYTQKKALLIRTSWQKTPLQSQGRGSFLTSRRRHRSKPLPAHLSEQTPTRVRPVLWQLSSYKGQGTPTSRESASSTSPSQLQHQDTIKKRRRGGPRGGQSSQPILQK